MGIKMKKTQPIQAENMETIEAKYHPIKDFKMDPAGYFLIRIHNNKLEAGLCKKDNIIEKQFIGDDPASIYNTIVRNITLLPEHAAYLGKELTKAEIAMKLNIEYIQDDPLDLTQK